MAGSGIRRVLVANRGEIARRVFATCRRLGISTVAVYSDPDADAAFVGEADVAVALGGAAPAESYLRGDAVLDAARRAGADAVHPGYGFLAENAAFAEAVLAAGLRWIGPSPEAIAAMGSKTEARDRMERAGVPVLPGARLDGEAGVDLLGLAEHVGYPLLVKASAGGGGKGMRLVEASGDLESAVAGARREAAGAFGDDTVFIERFAPRSRHVEIQIIGDAHGEVCALHERDCSVQRRHQKVIEEAPSPAVGPELRARMSAAAVAAGRGAELRRRRHGRVPPGRGGRLLLPRGQHAAAGRAPGHRARHRAGPGRAAAARRRGPRRFPRPRAGRRSAGTPSRRGCTPRTRRRASSRSPGRWRGSTSRRVSASTAPSRAARASARTTTR